MAFNIFRWLFQKSETTEDASTGRLVSAGSFLDDEVETAASGLEAYLQKMAFWTCVHRIADAVGAVEWETYRRGKKVKAKEYWSWNYSPNPNQTRQQFFDKLIGKLFSDHEVLVVETRDGSRYVADAFSTDPHLYGDVYQNIMSAGENIPGVFSAKDALHISLEGTRISQSLSALSAIEGKLIRSAVQNYIRRTGKRGILKIDDVAESDPDFEETYRELLNDNFKTYFTAENAVLPLFNGYEFQEDPTTNNLGSTQASSTTRDIRALMDDVLELTAIFFGIPSSVATGKNVTDADFNAFMTSVQPLISMLTQEINRKLYGMQLVSAGTYISANLAAVKYHDLFDIAAPIDKLIGSGAFCVNDIRVRLGMDTIDEEWADQHWMTKNYSPADELLTGVEDTPPAPTEPEKEEANEP